MVAFNARREGKEKKEKKSTQQTDSSPHKEIKDSWQNRRQTFAIACSMLLAPCLEREKWKKNVVSAANAKLRVANSPNLAPSLEWESLASTRNSQGDTLDKKKRSWGCARLRQIGKEDGPAHSMCKHFMCARCTCTLYRQTLHTSLPYCRSHLHHHLQLKKKKMLVLILPLLAENEATSITQAPDLVAKAQKIE